MSRKIVGNLFAESVWARMAAATRRAAGESTPSPLDPRYMPGDDVLERLAALATLLRVFAAEDDVLWVPRPVDAARMADVPGLPRPQLVTGARPTPGAGDLAWADASDVAAAVNDRRLAWEIQHAFDAELPGTSVVTSIDDVDDAVSAAAAASPQGTWIAKAVHSSAGRGRVGSRGPEVAKSHHHGIAKLLELHGAVIVEPWVPRLADFGATAQVDERGAADAAVHDLENTTRGDFRGVAFPAANLRDDERASMENAIDVVGRALSIRGYRGPLGIDAFRWRAADGSERFHPLCEINARMTMGRVARTAAERISAAESLPPGARWHFRVGDEAELAAARSATSERFFMLLLPAPPDGVAAWISG